MSQFQYLDLQLGQIAIFTLHKKGKYVTFVRGKYETKDNDSQDTSNNELNDDNDDIIIRIDTESNTQDDNTYSKESRVAKL